MPCCSTRCGNCLVTARGCAGRSARHRMRARKEILAIDGRARARRGPRRRGAVAGTAIDVARLLAAADVYCQPNVGPEAFGLTLAEALGAGLPVVTSRLGAAPEIVSDADGVLLPPGDAEALASALAALLTDRGRRRAFGAHGPARVAASVRSREFVCDAGRSARPSAHVEGRVSARAATAEAGPMSLESPARRTVDRGPELRAASGRRQAGRHRTRRARPRRRPGRAGPSRDCVLARRASGRREI